MNVFSLSLAACRSELQVLFIMYPGFSRTGRSAKSTPARESWAVQNIDPRELVYLTGKKS